MFDRRPALRSSARLASIGFLPILLTACLTEGRYVGYDESRSLDTQGRVVTFVDLYETGRKSVADYLAELPSAEREGLETMLARTASACARLEIIDQRSGMDYSQISGSAVLVRGSASKCFVATAGHSFSGVSSEDVTLTLRDGSDVDAAMISSSFAEFDSSSRDWAVLAVSEGSSDLPALTTHEPVPGELAFVLSYPNEMGVNEAGQVVYGHAYASSPLAPIVTVARVRDDSPLALDPIAGSLAMGGASGGAIVNRKGELIGILTGSGWAATKDGAEYWIHGATIAAFEEHLAR
ncbi:MAG: serine protease [Planctomycetota bacterium]